VVWRRQEGGAGPKDHGMARRTGDSAEKNHHAGAFATSKIREGGEKSKVGVGEERQNMKVANREPQENGR